MMTARIARSPTQRHKRGTHLQSTGVLLDVLPPRRRQHDFPAPRTSRDFTSRPSGRPETFAKADACVRTTMVDSCSDASHQSEFRRAGSTMSTSPCQIPGELRARADIKRCPTGDVAGSRDPRREPVLLEHVRQKPRHCAASVRVAKHSSSNTLGRLRLFFSIDDCTAGKVCPGRKPKSFSRSRATAKRRTPDVSWIVHRFPY